MNIPTDVLLYPLIKSVRRAREIVLENPNWLQEEYDNLVLWSAVPEEVWEDYFKESRELTKHLEEEYRNYMPFSGRGIFYWIDHPDEYNNWQEKYREITEKQKVEREQIERKLHKKYFYEYGLNYVKAKWI